MSSRKLIRSRLSFMLLFIMTLSLLFIVILPLLAVLLGQYGGAAFSLSGKPAEKVWDDYAYIFTHYGEWMLMSLWIGLASVGLCIVLCLPAAYSLVRYPFPGSRLIEELVLLPLSVPGIAVSIALLGTWSSFRGPYLVLGGHLLYTLPFMLRVLIQSMRSTQLEEMEMAAKSLGAHFLQRQYLILFPQIRHALVLGALLVYAVSWGEFNVSYLLNLGHPQTFPAALYNTYANESFARSSAATMIFLAGIAPVILMIQWMSMKSDTNWGDAA